MIEEENDNPKTEEMPPATPQNDSSPKISDDSSVFDFDKPRSMFENLIKESDSKVGQVQYHAPSTVVKERRKEVLDLLLSGQRTSEIYELISEKYGCAPTTVKEDVTQAYLTLRTEHGIEISELVDKHLGMYYENLKLARSMGDTRAANQALQYIEKLRGLHKESPVSVNIQQNSFKLDGLSVEDLLKIVHGNKDASDQNVINIPYTDESLNKESED